MGDLTRPPERLNAQHDLTGFVCGEPALDEWLRRHAMRNEGRGSRTYVLTDGGVRVIGFYALAVGSIMRAHATSQVRRNTPDPVPVMLLGRLAISEASAGQQLGRLLLRDAIQRTLAASEVAGITALVVHAMSERARLFYLRQGFAASDIAPMTLMIPLSAAHG